MNILQIIKRRCSIRKYKNKPIPKKILDKIIEAGRWGPSVVGLQPWKFIVVTNHDFISKISEIISIKSRELGVGGKFALNSTFRAISSSPTLIIVYNTRDFTKLAAKFGKEYMKISKLAEMEAIAASIQNMILVAESLNLGSCWLDTPLFCEKEINKLLNTNNELLAILTLGYPAEKGRRAQRKPISETVTYMY